MHRLQNQWSCSVLPQLRSCPRSGASFSSSISQQTPHGFPGRGCGVSRAGILTRGTVRGTIRLLYVSACACVQCGVVGGAIAFSWPLPSVSVCG